MYIYYFEKLNVWKISRKLVKDIYKITAGFPETELYGLTGQIRRAALSIHTNIAEGSARNSNKDQIRFTTFAYSSSMELLNLLILSVDLNYLDNEDFVSLRQSIEEISNKLNALKRSQAAKITNH